MANKSVNTDFLKTKLARWAECERQRAKLALKLAPSIKEFKAIEKEMKTIEKEVGALTIPETDQPPLIKDFAVDAAKLTFDTRTERTVAPKQWWENCTKKDREDEQFWGVLKVLIEKADKFRPVIVSKIASVSVTYSPKIELK